MADKELAPLSRRLRELRNAVGMSRMQLAVASGVSMSVIVQVEQGQRDDIKLSTADALARALGVALDELLRPAPKRRRKTDE